MSKKKLWSEHAPAMWRQGLRELRGAFYPDSNVAQPTEQGVWGTKTPGEVADDRRESEEGPSDGGERHSMIEERLARTPDDEPNDDMDLDIED